MAKRSASRSAQSPRAQPRGITRISVAGYKSINHEQSIEIRPLTILAGANSSGKSSMVQPLLLLKQTLEATYDPGALLLNGPNAHFTSARQFLSKVGATRAAAMFKVGVDVGGVVGVRETFRARPRSGIEIVELTQTGNQGTVTLRPGMSHKEIVSIAPEELGPFRSMLPELETAGIEFAVERTRCFLGIDMNYGRLRNDTPRVRLPSRSTETVEAQVRKIIHVPGLRGNPERTYDRTTATGTEFPGTFENYVASIISHWQTRRDKRLTQLSEALRTLGLAPTVDARQINDVIVELRVGRLPVRASRDLADMVSIADVGFGVSQTLPVLVALLVAEPGQLVYLEQPERHLHPRAQSAMAQVLADAARRGVRVVAETHSSLLLLGIQTLVAEGLPPDLVKLHWFRRGSDGMTEVASTDLDAAGAFESDWPEDFADVALRAESRYLDAAEARRVASAR